MSDKLTHKIQGPESEEWRAVHVQRVPVSTSTCTSTLKCTPCTCTCTSRTGMVLYHNVDTTWNFSGRKDDADVTSQTLYYAVKYCTSTSSTVLAR